MGSASLVLKDIVKVFGPGGKVRAVDELNLEIGPGEFVTLLGPSGCGKTTTLRLIAGFEFPTSGEITLNGKSVGSLPPNKRPMAMVFQSYALFPHMTVFGNIAYGLEVQKLSKREIKERTEKVMAMMGLEGMGDRKPHQLSGGQQQRVALARALVMEPQVLLFDEPLSNLDAKLREQMRLEIRSLQKRLGITTVYVTHDQAEAMSLSDRIAVMNDGRIEQIGSPTEIYRRPASVFVADFIGRANFIEGQVVERHDSHAVVKVFGKTVSVPNPAADLTPGREVLLVVRPEAVRLNAADAGQSFEGEVIHGVYLGATMEYEIDIQGERISVVVYDSKEDEALLPGSKVSVVFPEESFHVLVK